MAEKDVGRLLQKLIQEQESEDAGRPLQKEHFLTSLGVPLVRAEQNHFTIDVSDLRVFSGLSTFVQLLTHEVIEQCGFGAADIMVRRRLTPQILPEMVDMEIDWITIYARTDAAESIPFFHKKFGHFLHTVLGVIQTPKWGALLFPHYFGRREKEDPSQIPALLFPFNLLKSGDDTGYYMILERSLPGRFLRVTIEDASSSRLQLKHIRHHVVDNLDRHINLPQMHVIAEQIHHGVIRECMGNKTEYKEIPDRQGSLFEYLRKEGLKELTMIHFRWPTDDIQMLRLENRDNPHALNESLSLLNKELHLLGDRDILTHLANGHLVEMLSGGHSVFFETSRRSSCLNITLDARRTPPILMDYLDRMPSLKESCLDRMDALKGIRLFLIHHITSEVLGLIEAYRRLGCEAITTFFVKYAGIVPDDYLEALLSLPDNQFRSYSLQKVETRDSIRGAYILSRQHSDLSGLESIESYMLENQLDYLEATRFAGGHLFFTEAILCHREGKPLLLVEDGGYLAPLINQFCLEGKTIGEVFQHFKVDDPSIPPSLSFAEWMKGIFIGSVEHTKNGHDYHEEIMNTFGRLQFPVCSIAVSRLKRGPEARACAAAILNAIENIFHRLGLILMNRRVMILGSNGAIGQFLVQALAERVGADRVCGIDIALSDSPKKILEANTLTELNQEILHEVDTFIGVVGKSIMQPSTLEEILLQGKKNTLFFASGSTKTIEFKDLEQWLQDLCHSDQPRMAGKDISLRTVPLRDLQTGILQGHRVSIRFADDSVPGKDIYLFGALTPINFLYYGIPTEIIDHVMDQLLCVSVGLARRLKEGKPLPPKLLAVDYQIDKDAVTLKE